MTCEPKIETPPVRRMSRVCGGLKDIGALFAEKPPGRPQRIPFRSHRPIVNTELKDRHVTA